MFRLLALALVLGACSAAEGRSGRVLAPGEPDVELPDPASLPKPPASWDAGLASPR